MSVVVEAVAVPVKLIVTPERAAPLKVTVPDMLYVGVDVLFLPAHAIINNIIKAITPNEKTLFFKQNFRLTIPPK
jgi:hypothetical protein